jgi:hypothetical protein
VPTIHETHFKNGTEWTSETIEHGIETGHTDFVWADDPRTHSFAIHCRTCAHSFVIKAEALRADSTTRGRLLYGGVCTMNGKDILLETIKREVEHGKIERAKRKVAPTAWARILDDDESV